MNYGSTVSLVTIFTNHLRSRNFTTAVSLSKILLMPSLPVIVPLANGPQFSAVDGDEFGVIVGGGSGEILNQRGAARRQIRSDDGAGSAARATDSKEKRLI